MMRPGGYRPACSETLGEVPDHPDSLYGILSICGAEAPEGIVRYLQKLCGEGVDAWLW